MELWLIALASTHSAKRRRIRIVSTCSVLSYVKGDIKRELENCVNDHGIRGLASPITSRQGRPQLATYRPDLSTMLESSLYHSAYCSVTRDAQRNPLSLQSGRPMFLNVIQNSKVVTGTPSAMGELHTRPLSPPVQSDDIQVENEGFEHVPPDGGYGWVCVASCFTINCFTWGTVSVSGFRNTQHAATSPDFLCSQIPRLMVSICHTTWPRTCFPRQHPGTTLSSVVSTSPWPCYLHLSLPSCVANLGSMP